MNNIVNVNVGGKVQRFFIGFILPISSVFPIFIYPLSQEHLIESFFFTITFFAIPLVVINLITEMLQENNTFLFFLFSFFLPICF